MDDKSIKKNIFRFRKKSGLSQELFAEKIGMSRTAYRNIETGKTHIINENLERIAAVLNMSPEEVVLGYNPVAAAGQMVEDVKDEYNDKSRESALDPEKRIADLLVQNDTLKEYVEALKEIIRSKEEVIEMLKSYNKE